MMEAIAGAAMDMKSAQLAAEYSIAVTKKVMDTQELAAQELLNMLPATPPVVQKGQLIDTYALYSFTELCALLVIEHFKYSAV